MAAFPGGTSVFLLAFVLNRVYGVITESRPVAGFGAITLEGPFITTVEITGTESLTIQANLDDRNVTDSIEATVVDKSLRIGFAFPYNQNHNGDKFAGLIFIKVTAKKEIASFVNGGLGSLNIISVLQERSVSLVNQGSGNMSVNVQTENFNAVTSGSGGINVNGTTNSASFSVTGAGPIDAGHLRALTVSVAIYGAGDVTVNAKIMLSAMTLGSGSILYRGAARVSQTKMGVGNIKKID